MQNNAGIKVKKWYLRWWMWVIYVFIFFIVVGSLGDAKSRVPSSATNSSVEPVVQAPVQPTIKVTADQLMSDYNANEVSADIKYKGNPIQVSGIVDLIGKDILDTPYIALKTGGQYSISSIQCMFARVDQNTLATISKGQSITLVGQVTGKLGNVILNGCRIAK